MATTKKAPAKKAVAKKAAPAKNPAAKKCCCKKAAPAKKACAKVVAKPAAKVRCKQESANKAKQSPPRRRT